jgi:hypothetical protein
VGGCVEPLGRLFFQQLRRREEQKSCLCALVGFLFLWAYLVSCCFLAAALVCLTVSKKAKKGVSNGELGSSTRPGGWRYKKKTCNVQKQWKRNELVDLNNATKTTTHIKTKRKVSHTDVIIEFSPTPQICYFEWIEKFEFSRRGKWRHPHKLSAQTKDFSTQVSQSYKSRQKKVAPVLFHLRIIGYFRTHYRLCCSLQMTKLKNTINCERSRRQKCTNCQSLGGNVIDVRSVRIKSLNTHLKKEGWQNFQNNNNSACRFDNWTKKKLFPDLQ